MVDVTGILFLSTPIVAIVAGVGSSIFNRWTKHEQDMAHIKAMSGQALAQGQSSEIESLRQEMSQFRDTVMQYDMSVEKTLQGIKQRLDFIEGEHIARASTPTRMSDAQSPEVQEIGRQS
jgi:hypothetical protein